MRFGHGPVEAPVAEFSFALQGQGTSPVEAWRQEVFGQATPLTGDLEDYDADGLPNLLEFAFGTSPADGAAGPGALQFQEDPAGGGQLVAPGQPAVLTADGMQALFIRRRDYQAAGLEYLPEFSRSLANWEPATGSPVVVGTSGALEVVRIPFPLTGPSAWFRVRVSLARPAP